MEHLFPDDIASLCGGEVLKPFPSGEVKGVSVDSRSLREGDLFIALKGENFDGHDFIADAAGKGASAVMLQDPLPGAVAGLKTGVIQVADSYKAMGVLAANIRGVPGLPVLCVTGTNGKTTVKDMAASVLSTKYNVLKSPNSYNNLVGLSLTLFRRNLSHDMAVLEIGTGSPGEIKRLAEISRPEKVIITNIGEGHIGAFGTKRDIFNEKISILDAVPEGGAVFLNGDDEMLSSVSRRDMDVFFFGTSEKCDYRIREPHLADNGVDFFLNGDKYFIPSKGFHNVYNAAGVIAVSLNLGLDTDKIKSALKEFSFPGMRLERIPAGDIVFLDDSYNADPGSFKAAIETLEVTETSGARWVVAGDMLELGDRSREMHIGVGRMIGRSRVDVLIVMGGFAENVREGAIEGGLDARSIYRAASHADAADIIRNTGLPGSVILVKGSRKLQMENVIKCFTSSFIR